MKIDTNVARVGAIAKKDRQAGCRMIEKTRILVMGSSDTMKYR